jgi:hypothetical protein
VVVAKLALVHRAVVVVLVLVLAVVDRDVELVKGKHLVQVLTQVARTVVVEWVVEVERLGRDRDRMNSTLVVVVVVVVVVVEGEQLGRDRDRMNSTLVVVVVEEQQVQSALAWGMFAVVVVVVVEEAEGVEVEGVGVLAWGTGHSHLPCLLPETSKYDSK